MPRRSSLLQIPTELRERLNARLVQQGFSDYDGLLDWLHDELETAGLELRISRTALWRHGQKFEEKLEALRMATEQAKAISDGAEDDEGAMTDALVRLVQEKVFGILLELEVDPKRVNLGSLGKMVAQLSRASIAQKKYMREVRDEIARKAAAAAEKVAALTNKGGLSPEVAAQIRAEILGIRVDG